MNIAAALVVCASSLGAALADPRVMVTSTYTDPKGLHDLAQAAGGKYMGTGTDVKQLGDKYYLEQLKNKKDFGMITPIRAMTWNATEPEQGVFTFEEADKIVAVANETGVQLRCQPLVWHDHVPAWLEKLEKAELQKAMTNHITKLMTHFGDVCYSWDIVKDAIEEDGSYRKSFWYEKLGEDYINIAFKAAIAAKVKLGTKSKLYYDDYDINVENPKSDAIHKMIGTMRNNTVWVDGVGFQSHYSNNDTVQGAKIFWNLRRFTLLRIDVALTEINVKTSTAEPTVGEQQQQVGIYTNAVSACKKTKRCAGVTVWDFDDTYSPIESSAPLPWYQPGGPNTPLTRKATYDAITAGWIL